MGKFGFGDPIMKTGVKGMNNPTEPRKNLPAKDVGMVTEGVPLDKGYKSMSAKGAGSPQATPQNKGGVGHT